MGYILSVASVLDYVLNRPRSCSEQKKEILLLHYMVRDYVYYIYNIKNISKFQWTGSNVDI